WYWNDGGPLVVLPSEQASLWEGSDSPRDGRAVNAVSRWNDPSDPATDYDRACDVTESITLLGVGEGWGLVLSTELAQAAAWLPDESDARVTYLFGIANLDGDSDDALRAVLRSLPPDSWRILDPGL